MQIRSFREEKQAILWLGQNKSSWWNYVKNEVLQRSDSYNIGNSLSRVSKLARDASSFWGFSRVRTLTKLYYIAWAGLITHARIYVWVRYFDHEWDLVHQVLLETKMIIQPPWKVKQVMNRCQTHIGKPGIYPGHKRNIHMYSVRSCLYTECTLKLFHAYWNYIQQRITS